VAQSCLIFSYGKIFNSTVFNVPDSWNMFMPHVNATAVFICPAVNGVSCFAYILIIAFAAFDQVYDVTSLARCTLL